MLISIGGLKAQTTPADTLKKPVTDTIAANEDDGGDIEEPIKYNAEDSIVGLPLQGKGILYGKAWVTYGSMRIDAEFIELDYTKNLIVAYGKKDSTGKNVGTPVFKEGAEEMHAEKIMYNMKTKKGKIFNALTKQGELLVVGQEIKKDSSNIIYMKDMKCIPCQQEDARTVFRATKAKIIPDDKIVTGPMYLEIGGVPTPLGLPFGFFPNTKKQHSGIIMPTFGNSAERGFNLRQGGFYWGISDKTDLRFIGDVYANGSWVMGVGNQYKVLYKAAGSASITLSQFNNGDKDIPSQFNKQRAYQINWVHTQDNKSNPTIQFGANVNFVKNQQYNRFNAVNSGQYLTNTFNSNINFTKLYKIGSLSVNASHSQNMISRQMDITFPALTFNVNRFFPFKRNNATTPNVFDKIGINYLLTAQNTLTDNDSTIFKGNIENKMRYGIKHSIPISTNFNMFKYVTVTPAVNLNAYMYTKTTEEQYIPDYRGSIDTLITRFNRGFTTGYDASFSTAFNTKVYFDYMFKKGKTKQIRHLMIPTVTYSYKPDFSKQQYGFYKQVQADSIGHTRKYSIFENGIYGGPSIGEQNAMTLNLSNTLDAKLKQVSDTGISYRKVTLIQNLSLNTSYNFAADSFKMSNVGLTGRTVLFKNFDLNASTTFDPYGYNSENNRRVQHFAYNYNGKLARFTNGYFTLGTNFSSDKLQAARKLRKPPDMTNGAERGAVNDLNPDEVLPWNLNITYNLTLARDFYNKMQTTHALNTTADIMPTKYWKVGVTSGFDFTLHKLSYTSLNIYRDLKCWEARISWVPFGYNKSYTLSINLKSSMLSDFKIPRQSKSMDNPALQELFTR